MRFPLGLLAIVAAVGLLGFALASLVPQPEESGRTPGSPTPDSAPPEAPEPPVRFVAWGDAGHGNAAQYAAAGAIGRVCARHGCDFGLSLGDNIYPEGVHGPDDPQFRAKFEKPFANLTFPVYLVLGNHDVARPANGSDNGDHQVAYAQRSEKWRMPARSYSFERGPVAFVAVDMTRFADDARMGAEANATLAWLRGEMDNASDARWRIVLSHFPLAANGKHGVAGQYGGSDGKGAALREVVEQGACGEADLYLAGHDHILEWAKPRPGCPRTELVVSGAASEARPLAPRGVDAWFSQGDTVGFWWFEVRENVLVGRCYDAEGRMLFQRALFKL
ncbi:MAG TPA: metallophosphoesterase [Candidatus Thermoplasmatota archaeon]|nr:metallophosphoesterase [Candidatus Thermoplasmatota archaeon]